MPPWRVRELHEDDLDDAIRMWDDPVAGGTQTVFGISELIAAVRAGEPAVVAVVGDELVGTAVATVTSDRAWVQRISLAPRWRQQGIGSSMLGELERRLVAAGVHRISCLLHDETDVGAAALVNSGYRFLGDAKVYEKLEPPASPARGLLDQLGGRVLADTWDRLGGMAREKDLIERSIIMPLARPEEAERHGLVPPRAVVLFGPPGTGKTTFAKGIAGRLGWPFIELFPSRLADDAEGGLAGALREAFAQIGELDDALVFIDEVEEIAARRDGGHLTGVTNEMLKLIPVFRERPQRLLVCATNSIRALDTAFLRHGRFDHLIPVGPPDPTARAAIWDRYLRDIPHGELDMAAVVERSDLFTPADIEFASRRTAQTVFERAIADGATGSATTDDVLRAIADTRPTLSAELIASFEEDITTHART